MLKKLLKIFLIISIFCLVGKSVLALEKQVKIYFFWGEGCPHCSREKPFLDKLQKKYPEVKVYDFEVWHNGDNRKLLVEIGRKLNTNISAVPLTIIGEKQLGGWLSEETTGAAIEEAVGRVLKDGCRDLVGEILASQELPDFETEPQKCEEEPKPAIPVKMKLPVIGEIDTKSISLPVLTVIFGVLDGFNPCAMWSLLFLISLLLGMKDKKRRWFLGSAFIIVSALVYFLFMAAWLNLLLFIGFIVWVRIFIGLIALAGGGYNLWNFFTNKESGCKVAGDQKRQVLFAKIKNITRQRQFLLALGGIIFLAFSVNLVELVCSAGLPVVFTQILTLSNLPKWLYYVYMLLYIFFYMFDDLIIFLTAMVTLEMTGLSTKYGRISHLIGGIIMFIVGLLLIFKPQILMFG